MALMLLRFPDAPAGLRRGLARTLTEEQSHLRLYLNRMNQLGVEFGSLPVNDFFWRCFNSVDRIEGYLSGMSLTFEQANLDYSAQYAEAFEAVSDIPSAEVMRKVLADEIRHVAFGRVWLGRLRPEADLWQQYLATLPPPLVPRRCRADRMWLAPRRRAGLPESFISRVACSAESRGRNPERWTMNLDPDVGRTSTRSATTSLERDLAPLLQLLMPADDVIVGVQAPDPEFLDTWHRAGLPVRTWSRPVANGEDRDRATRGWADYALPSAPDHPGRALARKRTAARWERSWMRERRDPMVGPRPGASFATTLRELLHCSRAMLPSGPVRWKRDVGASGRGHRVVTEISAEDRSWAKRSLRLGGVVVEPQLVPVMELGLIWNSKGPVRVLQSLTDPRGRYVGHVLGAPWRRVAQHFGRRTQQVRSLLLDAAGFVRSRLSKSGFEGPAGADCMIHRRGGRLELRVIQEINPRFTMGHVAQALGRHLAPQAEARHILLSNRALQKHRGLCLRELHERLPSNLGCPPWDRGRLWTTDPRHAEHAGLLIVNPQTPLESALGSPHLL